MLTDETKKDIVKWYSSACCEGAKDHFEHFPQNQVLARFMETEMFVTETKSSLPYSSSVDSHSTDRGAGI